jgi:hypothetical protein
VNPHVLDDAVPLTPPDGSALALHDLGALDAARPIEPDLCGVLYRGSVNCLAGEPGVGKTWVAAAVVLRALARDGSAVIVDFEDTARTWAARLRALDVDPTVLGSEVMYLRPMGTPNEADIAWLARLVGEVGDMVVVLDSVPEALAMAGLDEDRSGDVSKWFQTIARPLAHAGASVLCIDHVTKAASTRGRWARGSGAKLAAVDGIALGLEIVEPFSRERSGAGQLTIAKDRHGAVGGVGEIAATVHFSVAGGGLYSVGITRVSRSVHGAGTGPIPTEQERESF